MPSARSLPSEILITIFKFLIPFDDQEDPINKVGYAPSLEQWRRYLITRHPGPCNFITEVCQHWRKTALSSHTLWARWDITLPRISLGREEWLKVFNYTDRFIQTLLKRSGNTPLSFSLTLHAPIEHADWPRMAQDVPPRFWEMIEKLLRVQKRWKVVRISVPRSRGTHFVEDRNVIHLHAKDLVILEDMKLDGLRYKIHFEKEAGMSSESLPDGPLHSSCPNLRRFELGQLIEDWTELAEMEALAANQLEEVKLFLFHDPRSKRLGHPPADQHDLTPTVIYPRLRLLDLATSLSTGSRSIEKLDFLIKRLRQCVMLDTLILRTLHPSNLTSVAAFLGQNTDTSSSSFSSLTSIELKFDGQHLGTEVDEDLLSDGLVAVLQSSPLLSSLKVAFLSIRVVIGLPFTRTMTALSLKNEDGVSFCLVPRLESLELSQVQAPCEVVSKAITSRWNVSEGHRSLRNVELLDCFVGYAVGMPNFDSTYGDIICDAWAEVESCVHEGLAFRCWGVDS